MGGTGSEEKHNAKDDQVESKKKEKKEKHEEDEDHGNEGKTKAEGEKKKKKKNPEDKKDPAKLRQKLEKLEIKMQAMVTKKEEILKLLKEVEQNAANPTPQPPSS